MTISEHTGDSPESRVSWLDEKRARKRSQAPADPTARTPVDAGVPTDDGGYTMGLADDYLSALDDEGSSETTEPATPRSPGDDTARHVPAASGAVDIDESDEAPILEVGGRRMSDEIIAAFSEQHAGRQAPARGAAPRGSADLSPDAASSRRRNSGPARTKPKLSPRMRPDRAGARSSAQSEPSTRSRTRRAVAGVAVLILVGVLLATVSVPGTVSAGHRTQAGKSSASVTANSEKSASTRHQKAAKTVSTPASRKTKRTAASNQRTSSAGHTLAPTKTTSITTIDNAAPATQMAVSQAPKTTPAKTSKPSSTHASNSSADQCPGASSPDSGCMP